MPLAHARFLRGGFWIVAVVLMAALVTAAVLTAREPRVYRASSTMVVRPSHHLTETGDILRSLETLERRSVIATLARLASAPRTREDAAGLLGQAPGSLEGYRVSGVVLPNTNIIRVDVEGPDAAMAARLAEAVAQVTRREVEGLYRIYTLKPLAAAEPPRRALRPDPLRNYTVAAGVGLFVGVLAAVLLGRRRAPAPS